MPKTAGIIIIGNEILSGKVRDTNSGYLATELRGLGVDVRRISVVPDVVAEIAAEVAHFSRTYDYVFTSGGVGPTHDDVTMRAVAEGFGLRMVESPVLAGIVGKWCAGRKSELALRMAQVPEGAEIVAAEDLKFPPVAVRNVYIFPGIPEYLVGKFAAIRERFRAEPFALARVFINEDECYIAAQLDSVDLEFSDVMVGSYPKVNDPEYKVMVTLECRSAERMQAACRRLLELLPPECVVRTEGA